MRFLEGHHARFLDAIFADLADPGSDKERPCSRVIDAHGYGDGSKGVAIMSVHIERIGKDQFALSHWYLQNGDIVYDPEVVFWRQFVPGLPGHKPGTKLGDQNRYAPVRYKQDSLGIDRELVEFEGGQPVRIMTAAQADCASFCRTWLKNIREQQGIDAKWTPPVAPPVAVAPASKIDEDAEALRRAAEVDDEPVEDGGGEAHQRAMTALAVHQLNCDLCDSSPEECARANHLLSVVAATRKASAGTTEQAIPAADPVGAFIAQTERDLANPDALPVVTLDPAPAAEAPAPSDARPLRLAVQSTQLSLFTL